MIKKIIVGSLQCNCYVYFDEETKNAFLIDPGDDYKKINRFLKEKELILKAIFLTHGHIDHIGAVQSFLTQNPSLPIYIHNEDALFLTRPEMNLSSQFGKGSYILKTTSIITLEDQQMVTIGNINIICRHYPGHTPGSCMYFVEDENIIFSGDVLFSKSIGRFDLPYGNRIDTIQSLRKIKLLKKDYVIYPGHDEKTTLSEELQLNPYLLQINWLKKSVFFIFLKV